MEGENEEGSVREFDIRISYSPDDEPPENRVCANFIDYNSCSNRIGKAFEDSDPTSALSFLPEGWKEILDEIFAESYSVAGVWEMHNHLVDLAKGKNVCGFEEHSHPRKFSFKTSPTRHLVMSCILRTLKIFEDGYTLFPDGCLECL